MILDSTRHTTSSRLILALLASLFPLRLERTTRGFRLQIWHCASRYGRPPVSRDIRVLNSRVSHLFREHEQYLQLPPVHLVGIETVSVNCAQRFAILCVSHLTPFGFLTQSIPVRFPDMVLSLTLINVPPPTEYEQTYISTTNATNQHPPPHRSVSAGPKPTCTCWTS